MINSFILSQKSIPDLNSFHKAIKAVVPEFIGFNIEDSIISVELNCPITQELINAVEAVVPPATPIPLVTPRQIRQALILSNVSLSTIDTAIDNLEEPQRSLARVEWEYSTSFDRNRYLVSVIAQILGWTEQQLDDLWLLAASLA